MNATTNLIACDEQICNLFSGLFDTEVGVKQSQAKTPISDACVAVFGSPDGVCTAMCWCELSLANTLGAALAVIPAAYADENTEANEFPENLRENFGEVMNLCSNLFPKQQSVGFSLQAIYLPTDTLPEEVTALAEGTDGERVVVELSIERYRTGTLSVLTT